MFPLLTPIIVLPETAATDIGAGASQFITDLSPVWLLIMSVLLGALVIIFLIGVLKK